MTRVHRIGAATSTSSTQGAGWVGMKWKDTENGFPEELVQSSVWKGSHDLHMQARECSFRHERQHTAWRGEDQEYIKRAWPSENGAV